MADNLQAMTDSELADTIARAESNLQRALEYVQYLDSCSVIRRRQLMSTSEAKVRGWRTNLALALSEQAGRIE